MKYNQLLNTDFMMPEISLGTMTFGGQTNEKDSLSIMDYAFEHGVTLFDTANIYTSGNSEIIVGKGLKGRRDKLLLATKVGYGNATNLSDTDLSAGSIKKGLDESLKRLDTDYIDLYYLHAPDYHHPIEEALETMSELIESGKIKHMAISNFSAWQIADLLNVCEKNGFIKPVMTQNVYNALTRSIEPELLPFLKAHELGLTVYNPIAAGLLTGKHDPNAPLEGSRLKDNKIYHNRYWTDANLNTTGKLMKLAADFDMTILDMAMQWCISNPQVTSIITGVSSLSQLKQNLKSIDGAPLSSELMENIAEIWKEHTGNPFGYNR